MHARCSYDYAVIRVVPARRARGVRQRRRDPLVPRRSDFLEARIELDEARLRALDPTLDLAAVRAHLDVDPAHLRRRRGRRADRALSPRERFHWLTAPRSTIIQSSAAHTGRCTDPAALLDHLVATMVRTPTV